MAENCDKHTSDNEGTQEQTDFRRILSDALGEAPKKDAHMLPPLVLAFVGDTVFDLAVRTLMIDTHDAKVHELHVLCAHRVKASAQAQAVRAMLEGDKLTEPEREIFLRARNAKPGTIPKNASPQEYSYATGLEALIGYLFLTQQQTRMLEIIKMALDYQSQSHENKKAARVFKAFR